MIAIDSINNYDARFKVILTKSLSISTWENKDNWITKNLEI